MSEPRVWTPEKVAELRGLWDKDLSLADLAAYFGSTIGAISTIARRNNFPKKRLVRSETPKRLFDRAKKMEADGMDRVAIAVELGVSRTTLWRVLGQTAKAQKFREARAAEKRRRSRPSMTREQHIKLPEPETDPEDAFEGLRFPNATTEDFRMVARRAREEGVRLSASGRWAAPGKKISYGIAEYG